MNTSIRAHRLGLTGGIGSGKSTVAGMLGALGATVIDADAIARSCTAPGGAAITAIAQAFGSAFITSEGALDREQMRALVFKEPSAKARLESIIHPLVGAQTAQQAQDAEHKGTRCIVFDVPLLVESAHWRKKVDRVLVVDCLESTQVRRVMERNGLSEVEVQRIMAAQARRLHRLSAADLVVYNDTLTLDALRLEVAQIGAQFGL